MGNIFPIGKPLSKKYEGSRMEGISENNELDELWGFLESASGIPGDKPVDTKKNEIPDLRMVKRRERRHKLWRLGNSLEMWRAIHRLTQAQLGEKVGVSRRTISAIENQRHQPALSLALAIAEVFGVPVEKIFTLRKPQFNKGDRTV